MTPHPKPDPPAGLKAEGKRLWAAIIGDLADGWQLDAREIEFLTRACSAAEHLADLEAAVERDGVMVTGSRGQLVVNPAVSEIRQTKLMQARLLGSLELTDPSLREKSATPGQARARRAAHARWNGG